MSQLEVYEWRYVALPIYRQLWLLDHIKNCFIQLTIVNHKVVISSFRIGKQVQYLQDIKVKFLISLNHHKDHPSQLCYCQPQNSVHTLSTQSNLLIKYVILTSFLNYRPCQLPLKKSYQKSNDIRALGFMALIYKVHPIMSLRDRFKISYTNCNTQIQIQIHQKIK